jgi:hypothetical protein
VEEHTASFIDNIRAVVISQKTAASLQQGAVKQRKEPGKGAYSMSVTSEVTTQTINEEVWKVAKKRAVKIATDMLLGQRGYGEYGEADIPIELQRKINAIAANLIVVYDDQTVVVYNNITQARLAKKPAS